jgi:LysM repeat protein
MAGGVLLLTGLLIKDSLSEHAKAAASISVAADLPEPQSNTPVLAADLKSVSIPQPAGFQSAPAVPKANISPAGHSESVYVVKSGDTLTRIARAHRTTVKTIVVANSLTSDRISIGTKLKMPEI